MSHIQSHHSGTDETHNTFLVVFKVHGETIHLWQREKMQTIGEKNLFWISCHSVETHSEPPNPEDIQVFLLNDPAVYLDSCKFQSQKPMGQAIGSTDLAIFMSSPMVSSRKASYAIKVAIGPKDGCIEDMNYDLNPVNYEKIGTAYVYLDPKFSSQGIQRTPIIASNNHAPIGQLQIDYLIITNPVAYGRQALRLSWPEDSSGALHCGHRGSGAGRRLDLDEKLMENTIASFNYAHRNGADLCELDVLVSADGIPIVYHDFDVDAVTAHQSSDQLGKFRVQVNQFTVEQLRDFRLLSLNDKEGCPYTLKVSNQAKANKPFPTLAEVLNQVDSTCGLNIEIKWPQLLESGKMEARKYREINDFVDRIIDVVSAHAGNRKVVLESFDADLVILLRLKQDRFPVIFLTQGMTDRYERYVDLRARSVRNGIYFAQAFDLAGIDIILDYYLESGKELVQFVKSHNLVARAWGDFGEEPEKLCALEKTGLQCITYDKVDLLRKAARAFKDMEKERN